MNILVLGCVMVFWFIIYRLVQLLGVLWASMVVWLFISGYEFYLSYFGRVVAWGFDCWFCFVV